MVKNGVRLDTEHNILWTRTVSFESEEQIEEHMGQMSEAMEELTKGFLVIEDISQFTFNDPEEVMETWAMIAEVYDFKVQTRIGKVIRIYGGNDAIRKVWEEAGNQLKAGVPIYYQPSFT